MFESSQLKKVPFFSRLSEEELATLASIMGTKRLPPGGRIYARGDTAEAMYLVAKGRVELYQETTEGEIVVLQEIKPLQIFGEVGLLDGGEQVLSARAAEPTVLQTLDRQDLLELLVRHPRSALALMGTLGSRLRSTAEVLRATVSRNVNTIVRPTASERFSEALSSVFLSWAFHALMALAAIVWVGVNLLRPGGPLLAGQVSRPIEVGLLFIVTTETTLMMFQLKALARRERARSELEYQLNLKLELELLRLGRRIEQALETRGGTRPERSGAASPLDVI